ncbi:hypothetical protein Barb6XT_00839 [Bacteroidales bacterium Barb6XT]|nr:hypothetical protein Barb6XT_00839 [Bacteroidales bacterium Barb6XT]
MKNSLFTASVLLLFSSFAPFTAKGQGELLYCTDEDRAVFDRYLSAMQQKRKLPAEELLVETARFFLDTPYVAATLEKEPEGLVVNLREMDCFTFVENVICLVRTVQEKQPSFENFCRNLRTSRYREGIITDYTDRLHYTTDWIYESEQKGFLKDVTREMGGELLPLSLSFMSAHPDSYRQLKGNPARIRQTAEKEKEISSRPHYYISAAAVERSLGEMHNGDIVGFVSTVAGLDLSHVGIIYKKGEKLTFIHASSVLKKVIVNEEPLAAYVKRMKSNKGVMIVRFIK